MKNLKVFSKDMSNVHISKAVELARELEIYGEYELVAQFEKQDKKEDCLSVIAGAIKKRLESEVPSFSIHDDIIKIDTLEIIRILNKFCMAFLGYLSKNTISLLEDAVDKHLQNTKSVIGFDLKADVGIVPPLIHKTCKHTQGIVRVLESFGLTLAYCYCEDVSNPIYHRQKAMYGDCLYFYMFDIKVIVSSYNLPLYRLKKVPQILYINHVFNSVLKYLCWKKEEKYFYNAILEYRLLRCHYSLCHTKSEKKLLKLALEKYKISEHKIIKSGYPSFDESYKSFNFLNKTIGSGGGGEYLLIAPSHIGKFLDNQMIFEVIVEKLEEGMKIILRGHPSFINEEKKKYEMQLRILSQYKDFIFDDGNAERFCKKMRIDYVDTLSIAMYNSFALLSDSSSLAYTYPFVSLKPCIMYLDDLLEGGISLDGISYCNKIMHLVVHNADDLKKSINKAMDKNIQQEYAINIKQLQNKEIYNIEHSAKEIAVAIKRILRKNNL